MATNSAKKPSNLKVVDEGSGVPVVLIHGWPVTDYHWRYIVPLLQKGGYRTLMVTPRGLGDGSVPESSVKSDIANEILRALRSYSIDEYCLIGHDWGGTLGYLIASKDRKKCRGLVMEEEILPGVSVDIPKPGSEYYPSWHGPFNRSVGLGESLISGNEDIYYGTFLRESAGPKPLEDSAIETYLNAYRSKEQLLITLDYYRTQKVDRETIGSVSTIPLNIPVLCVGGQYAMGTAVAAGMRTIEKDISELICNDAGHYPAEQNPRKFANSVLNFLLRVYNERV